MRPRRAERQIAAHCLLSDPRYLIPPSRPFGRTRIVPKCETWSVQIATITACSLCLTLAAATDAPAGASDTSPVDVELVLARRRFRAQVTTRLRLHRDGFTLAALKPRRSSRPSDRTYYRRVTVLRMSNGAVRSEQRIIIRGGVIGGPPPAWQRRRDGTYRSPQGPPRHTKKPPPLVHASLCRPALRAQQRSLRTTGHRHFNDGTQQLGTARIDQCADINHVQDKDNNQRRSTDNAHPGGPGGIGFPMLLTSRGLRRGRTSFSFVLSVQSPGESCETIRRRWLPEISQREPTVERPKK